MKKWKRSLASALTAALLLIALVPAVMANSAEGAARASAGSGSAAAGEQFSFSGSGSGLALTTAPNVSAGGNYVVTALSDGPELEDVRVEVTADPTDESRQKLIFSGTIPSDAAEGSYEYQIGFRLNGSSLVIPVTTITITVTSASGPTASPSPSQTPSASPNQTQRPLPTLQPAPGWTPNPGPIVTPSPVPSASRQPTAGPEPALPQPNPDGPLALEIKEGPDEAGLVITGVPVSSAAGIQTASELFASLRIPADTEPVILSSDGQPLEAGAPLGTGCRLVLRSADGRVLFEAQIVVSGDVLGTGTISITQVVRMAQALNGTRPLEGIYALAGDFNSGGGIDIADLVREAQILNGIAARCERLSQSRTSGK